MNSKSLFRKRKKQAHIIEEPSILPNDDIQPIINAKDTKEEPNEYVNNDSDEENKPSISIETYTNLLEKLKKLNNDFNGTRNQITQLKQDFNNINNENNALIAKNDSLKERIYLFHICMIIITIIQSLIIGCFAMR